MLIVLRNTTERIHRTSRSSTLNRDSGSEILGCWDVMSCSSAHLDVASCSAPYDIASVSTTRQYNREFCVITLSHNHAFACQLGIHLYRSTNSN